MWGTGCQPGCVHHLGEEGEGDVGGAEQGSGIHLPLPWARHPTADCGHTVSESGPLGFVLFLEYRRAANIKQLLVPVLAVWLLYSPYVPTEPRVHLKIDFCPHSLVWSSLQMSTLVNTDPKEKRTKRSTKRQQKLFPASCPGAFAVPVSLLPSCPAERVI